MWNPDPVQMSDTAVTSLESAFTHNMCAPRNEKKNCKQSHLIYGAKEKGCRERVCENLFATLGKQTVLCKVPPAALFLETLAGVSFHGSQDINLVCIQTCSLKKTPIHIA